MVGKIYLGGGGDEKDAFAAEDNFFKDVNSVLYIPLAWANEDFESCLNWFTDLVKAHHEIEIRMLTDVTQEIDLSKFDGVYIGGGNTFKLLKKLKESKLGKKLINFYESGGKIFGGSAGAIIWGKTINISTICKDADRNIVKLKDLTGFAKVGKYDIQCHFESNQINEHKKYIRDFGNEVIAIPEESALIVEGNKCKVIGEKSISIITSEEVTQFSPGSSFEL
jgi:dipeptidase E